MDHCNEADVDWSEQEHGDHAFRRKHLSEAVESEKLGCSIYEIEPGSRSWPYHYHTANEEAVFVLQGTGVLRSEDGERPVEEGDFVALPTGESGGHQFVNDGDRPLRYLMVSTMVEPDVTIYPEMGTFGVYAGSPPGGREERSFEGYFPLDAAVDYWNDQSNG